MNESLLGFCNLHSTYCSNEHYEKLLNMNTTTLINDLTETEILSAVREKFAGELVADMDMERLVDQATTLGDLFQAIQLAIDARDNDGKGPQK